MNCAVRSVAEALKHRASPARANSAISPLRSFGRQPFARHSLPAAQVVATRKASNAVNGAIKAAMRKAFPVRRSGTHSATPAELPPDAAPKSWRQALEEAVLEGRPMFPALRGLSILAMSAVLLSGLAYGYYWQHMGDGSVVRGMKELALKHSYRVVPNLEELADFDIVSLFEGLDPNGLSNAQFPTWWINSASLLSVQLNAAAGLTSQFLHADLFHVAFSALLAIDLLECILKVKTPWMPLYTMAFLMAGCLLDLPKVFAIPFGDLDEELVSFAERMLANKDEKWMDLYSVVNEPEEVDGDAGALLSQAGKEWFESVTLRDIRRSLESNASLQAFWLLTFFQQPMTKPDVDALVRPTIGLLPFLTAAYSYVAMEGIFAARLPVIPLLFRPLALAAMGVWIYFEPHDGRSNAKMQYVPPSTSNTPEVDGYSVPSGSNTRELNIGTISGVVEVTSVLTGMLAWTLTFGPLRAIAYALIRRKAARTVIGV
jgi:hypothetical protein